MCVYRRPNHTNYNIDTYRSTTPDEVSQRPRGFQSSHFGSWTTDLYPWFSLISLICTLVLQFVLYPVFSEGGWDQISMKHAKSRYSSNCKTKVQIKEIKENQGYSSDPQDHKPKVQITTSLLICTLGFPGRSQEEPGGARRS